MGNPVKMMIVEDSEDDTQLILRQIKKGGFDPTWERVDSLEAMSEALERSRWDVILTDFRMPRFDGAAALAMVKNKGLDIPVIVISGYLPEDAAVDLLKAGAKDFVKKGNWSRLIPAIHREIQEARSRAERCRDQKAREEAEARYTNLFVNAVEGIFQCTPQGRFLTVNPAMARILGYEEGERLRGGQESIRSRVFVRPEDFDALVEEVRRQGECTGFEAQVKRENGEVLWVALHTKGICGPGGSLERIEGFMVDISGRKKVEEALRQAEEKYRSFFENSVVGIFQTSLDGRFLNVNPSLARHLGYASPRELMEQVKDIGTQLYKSHADRDCLVEVLKDKQEILGFETQLLRKDGSSIWVSLSARLVSDPQGQVAYLEGSAQDITARKTAEEDKARLEEQLRQSQKMEAVGTLAGGIAHDFNNLLQTISGHVQLLLMQKGPEDKDRRYLEVVDRTVGKATELIRQLLTFSRKTEPSLRQVELNDLVLNVTELLKRTIPKMISLQVRPGEGRLELCADPVQLERVIINLVNNSCDAMPEGGTIVIETGRMDGLDLATQRYMDLSPGPYCLLSVSDTGQGMDEDTRKHIFEPFFTTKKIGAGTGIGLSSVYGIVKAHGGMVSCVSQPGLGSSFKIVLPNRSDLCGIPPVELPTRHHGLGGRETVLVVDDEPFILELAREALEQYGYTVITATSGEEALEVIAQGGRVDIVLLDLGMPGMGGEQCLERLRAEAPGIKVVVASGYGTHKLSEDPSRYGAAAFLNKPYRIEGMVETLRVVLDKATANPA